MPESPENPRLTILDEDTYENMMRALAVATKQWVGTDLRPRQAEMMLDAVLPLVHIMWPMEGSYDETMCPSMLATQSGWIQCEDEPGHEGPEHEGGDWGWGDDDNANVYRGDLKPENRFADVVEERDLLRAQLDAVLGLQKREFHSGDSLQDFQDVGYNEALRQAHNAAAQAEVDYRRTQGN